MKRIISKLWNSVAFWTVFALTCVTVCMSYAAWQIMEYEHGVLSIYANQQDAYVQLVLDQINLNKDSKDESAILEIIGTLDSSSNKYWTLSQDETILFVKDVLETNRYKGFTTDTYYYTDSAQAFLNTLQVNHVANGRILVGDKEYIASGVLFQYANENYQICLLTNPDVVLDQNEYLSAKINLNVMIIAVLSIFLVAIIGFGRMIAKRANLLEIEVEKNKKLNYMVEALNEVLRTGEMYDARLTLFRKDCLKLLYAKLQERQIVPVTFLLLECDSERDKEYFLADAYLLLNKKIIRFQDDASNRILLVCLHLDEQQSVETIEWILYRHLRIVAKMSMKNIEEVPMEQALEMLYSKVEKDEKRII